MIPRYRLRRIVEAALEEDLGHGDLTSWGTDRSGKVVARIMAKEEGVVAGHSAAGMVFELLSPGVRYEVLVEEGQLVDRGTTVAKVVGAAGPILEGERTALNFLMHLSGIATTTRTYVEALQGTGVTLLDTRKTTPGLRDLEKAAVRAGGGKNHRLGLDGGVLIKDTHLATFRDIAEAVKLIGRQVPHSLVIEVEVRTYDEAMQAYRAGAGALLLDNMGVDEVCRVCSALRDKLFLEVSGGITLDNIRDYARCRPHAISTSAVVTRARWMDMSMVLEPLEE